MTHPIGYYTACLQGQGLVKRFGERDLAQLPQIDQAALLAILGQFVYQNVAFANSDADRILLEEAAGDAIPPDNDETTDAIQEAIALLENISSDDAIGVMRFLVQ